MHREPRDPSQVRLIVIHTNEGPEQDHAAPALAEYLKTIDGGYHEIVDNRDVVRTARDDELVYGAGGHNADAYHVCLIGYANQTDEQWADPYSTAELKLAAGRVADACKRFGIPAIKLDPVGINTGQRGITDHLSVSRATGTSNPHTDPGVHFPWLKFIVLVRKLLAPVPAAPKVSGLMSLTAIDSKHDGTPGSRVRFVRVVPASGKFTVVPYNGAKVVGKSGQFSQAAAGNFLGVEGTLDGDYFVVTYDDGGTFKYQWGA